MTFLSERKRLLLAVLIPVGALAAQWVLWPYIKPFVWFLFFPAVFFSARLGGLRGGLLGAVISALLVWYAFMPPQLAWDKENPANLWSVGLFLVMGYLIGDAHERLGLAKRRTEAALAETRAANEQITRLYQQTRELDELKSQFFANVSHELRTPLTLILGPLARRLARQDLPEEERRDAEMMQRNARMLYRHVSDLLDAAKLEAGGLAADYARIDLAEVVRATASHFDSLAAERGIVYTVATPETLGAEVDGEKIQRIVLNLLSNAFKFISDGGTIAVRLSAQAGDALIQVQDDGPGVPADMREAVFERFRQVEGDARRRFGGTGLGLAIVKEFAQLHGGRVQVDDAPGGGALFSVVLPMVAPVGMALAAVPTQLDEHLDRQAVEELHVPSASPTPIDEAGAEAPLVLVVEDNADMRAFIADTLRSRYRVACAADGREGIEQAQALKPDLILADVMMPRLSGDQMAIELRHQEAFARVPIVMLTARADEELRVRMLQSGVQDYLNKPFSVEELMARVGSLVAARRQTLEELRRSAERLRHLAEVVERIAGVRDLSSLMTIVRHAVRELTGADGATLVLRDDGYCHYVDEDAIGPLWKGQRFPLESCISGWAMLHAQPVAIEDIYADERIPHAAYRPTFVKSLSMVPIRRETPVGAIGCYWAIHHRATDEEVELQQALADAMSVGLANLDLFDRMETARQAAEQATEEIRRLNADLERRVAERTAELTAANRELDAFAYAVSHDLRAPLRAMSGFSTALLEDYGDKLDGEAKVYLDQIGIASRKMGDLIEGILALSRSTRSELLRETVDLSAVANRLLADLARGEPDRQVVCHVAPGLTATADARMIEVVMANLLGNAWKYTARRADAVVRVDVGDVAGQRGICVSDNGAGFDMAHSERLFKPFQRLHRQDEFPGIGIGLATVQRIVHRHGGEIRAEGRPGEGATFCFTLPAAVGGIGGDPP